MLAPDERLVFLHIPKCAGTSLHRILAAQFKPKLICPHRGDTLPSLDAESLRPYRFFSGHVSKAGVDAVPGPKRVVTVLREPRERVLSLYYFWRSHRPDYIEKHNLAGPRTARELPLVEFLKSDRPEVMSNINNHLVRSLLGPLRIGHSLGYRLSDRDFAVDTALLNLQRFNFVSFAHTLKEDVPLLLSILGMKPVEDVPVLNRFGEIENTDHREVVEREEHTDEVWDLLNRATYLDRLFYDRALVLRHSLRCPYPN